MPFKDKIKAIIKSNPLLRCILLRGVAMFRRLVGLDRIFDERRKHFRRYCSNLSQVVSEPVFVKIGANDGITGDPCSDILLADTKWRGLLIEPVPYCFDRLKKNFSDSKRFFLEQVAIGAAAGKAVFYYVDQQAAKTIPNLPNWFDQLGSFHKDHILKHLGGMLEPFIVECLIEVCRIVDVLRRNEIRNVHLLHIDTEGYDWEVIKTWDFSNQPPVLVFVEHKHLPSHQKIEMLHLLQKNGYSVSDCGSDYFAINKKVAKRLRLKG